MESTHIEEASDNSENELSDTEPESVADDNELPVIDEYNDHQLMSDTDSDSDFD